TRYHRAMQNVWHVAIVGGGIAGLASAIFLARAGHRVEVFEKMPGIVANGTGILLQPAGIDVLRRLHLADAAFALGCVINRVAARARTGAKLMDLRYADLRPDLRGLGIRRPALADLLLQAARAAGAKTHFGARVESIHEERDRISVVEHGGTNTQGPFDVALLCDGTNSRLRDGVSSGAHVRAHPRGVYSLVAPLPASLSGDTLLQSLNDMRDGAGLLPIGRAGGETPLVSFFWNALSSERPQLEARGYSAWCDYIETFCPEAGEFLRGLEGFGALTWSATAEVSLHRWHSARTLVIGDSAHALNPQLGLGATMALLDAECVAQCLSNFSGDVTAALTAFQLQRKRQVDRYARVSRFWSRLDDSGFSPLRRRLFLAAANSSLLRGRLLRHVCGYA
ncbi:MAG TPA: NAD(P)/FAD-dependent oxidoreductase, partial [Steroidobacteraceae bacterium]|nr:NAD(P)/FAD-dependent oxidoreductase [Steroidobacteraceae bacterium]